MLLLRRIGCTSVVAMLAMLAMLASCATLAGLEQPSDNTNPQEVGDSAASTPDGGGSPADSSGTDGDGIVVEPVVGTFPCGANVCIAGQQACCPGVTTTCVAIDAGGCGGGGAQSGLKCTTYANCGPSHYANRCCYNATTGESQCRSLRCNNDEESLCTRNTDQCGGGDWSCESLSNPPGGATTIGRCKDD